LSTFIRSIPVCESSGTSQIAKKLLAEDPLKSALVFRGGYSEYVGWSMTARRLIKVGYYSKTTGFLLLKITLEGEVKRIGKKLSIIIGIS
jgi:hypothetical protein